MKITSPAFENGKDIPSEYTCDGNDKFPELEIKDAPAGVKTFALICDDPDAPVGTWDHLVCWNISSQTKKITSPSGIIGKNSWGRQDWGGPCPPSGKHRYYFKLFALDTELDLAEGSTKQQLMSAMEEHTLAKAELMGTYSRKNQQFG